MAMEAVKERGSAHVSLCLVISVKSRAQKSNLRIMETNEKPFESAITGTFPLILMPYL